MELKEQIKNYYFEHLDDLPKDKQFHFASRLGAWQGDATSKSKLSDLKSYMTLDGDYKTAYENILSAPVGNVYAKKLRAPYFEKYPQLYGIHNCLFRIRHLQKIYGIDTRKFFLDVISLDELSHLYTDLLHDKEAIFTLSRFAVDYFYLFEILFDQPRQAAPDMIASLKNGRELSELTEIQLLIYLYTHAIIADTIFYIRVVPADRLATYQKMLTDVEKLLKQYPNVKLDVKFEFLVACRICHYKTDLFSVIHGAAACSISPKGKFIVDKLTGSTNLNSFAGSEHRNVLYIMSGSSYSPASA